MIDFNTAARQEEDEPKPEFVDADTMSALLRDTAARWVPIAFPQGRRDDDGHLRVADITGRPPRKHGSCVVYTHGDHAGSWHDFDGGDGGGPLSTVARRFGIHGDDLFAKAKELAGRPPEAIRFTGKPPTARRDYSQEVSYILSRCVPLTGTDGEGYLRSRAITTPLADLAYHPDLTHYKERRGYRGIVARFRKPTGELIDAIHRTFIGDDGKRHDRKMLNGSGVIILAQISADGVLGVGEGIESTASGMQYFGIPGWALGSTAGFKYLADFIAEHGAGPIKRLEIFADRGKGGEDAAQYLARAARVAGIDVLIRLPAGEDFNKDAMDGLQASTQTLPIDTELPTATPSATQPLGEPQQSGNIIIFPGAPYDVAKEFRNREYRNSEFLYTLHHHRSEIFGFDGKSFQTIDEETLRSVLYKWLAKCKRRDGDKILPVLPSSKLVSAVEDALRAVAQLNNKIEPPFWLTEDSIPAKELIVCQNVILHWKTGETKPNTPALFNINALDFEYQPSIGDQPDNWLLFLCTLWPDDEESISTLQEIFGLAITSDTSFQKILMLIGPARSGKGTIARILTRLVGMLNVCAPTLRSLGDQFGLQPLLYKTLAIIGDARIGPKTDTASVAERLLSISGEDFVTVERKFLPAWHGQLPLRFLIISNELPKFSDASGALASRFVMLTMTKSFLGKENPNLLNELVPELPQILNWAIAGLKRLKERGYFIQPTSAKKQLDALDVRASPMRGFLAEFYQKSDGGNGVLVEEFWQHWLGWCEANNIERTGTKPDVGHWLHTAWQHVETTQLRTGQRGQDGKKRQQRWFLGVERKTDDA